MHVIESGNGSSFPGSEIANANVEGFAGVCVDEEMVTIYVQEYFIYLLVLAVFLLQF